MGFENGFILKESYEVKAGKILFKIDPPAAVDLLPYQLKFQKLSEQEIKEAGDGQLSERLINIFPTMMELIESSIIGWSGVIDEKSQEILFSKDLVKTLLKRLPPEITIRLFLDIFELVAEINQGPKVGEPKNADSSPSLPNSSPGSSASEKKEVASIATSSSKKSANAAG